MRAPAKVSTSSRRLAMPVAGNLKLVLLNNNKEGTPQKHADEAGHSGFGSLSVKQCPGERREHRRRRERRERAVIDLPAAADAC